MLSGKKSVDSSNVPTDYRLEYRRRLLFLQQTSDELSQLEARVSRLRQGIVRLIDSYAEGFINKDEFGPRVTRMRERLKQMEEQAQLTRAFRLLGQSSSVCNGVCI